MGWVKTEKTNKLSKLGDIDFITTAPVNGNVLVYNETDDVWIPGAGGGGSSGVELTQAQYDALTPAEKNNGTIYQISDKGYFYYKEKQFRATKELTQAQYDALTPAQKADGTIYMISDAEDEQTETLEAGQTSLVFTSNILTSDSKIDWYIEEEYYGIVAPKTFVTDETNHTLTLTFDAQQVDVDVKVVIK